MIDTVPKKVKSQMKGTIADDSAPPPLPNNVFLCKLTVALSAICFLMLSVIFSTSAFAQEKKVVRVGWYDSEPFTYFDRFGRRRGYAYEYQQKIAAYTGWTYEYVDGS